MMQRCLATSLLAADFACLASELALVQAADYIHIDVMDGVFVPNITVGPPVIKRIKAHTKVPLDIHLMVTQPSRYVRAFLEAGADILTLHVESDTQDNLKAALHAVWDYGARPAITLKPGTHLGELVPYLSLCTMVLIMTVEPGFGGQELLPGSLARVRKARMLLDRVNPSCDLEVDGGVTLDNVRTLAEAGANVFVAGSAVFDAADVPGRVEDFKNKLSLL